MHRNVLWRVTVDAAVGWWNDNCIRLSASLAYYTALSLAPLVIIVIGLVGMFTERQQVAGQLERQLELLLGPPGRQVVHAILMATEPQGGTLAAVIGVAALLMSATAVFGELQAALNLVWEVQPVPQASLWRNMWMWCKQRLLSLAMVLAIAFLLLVSLVISAALSGLAAYTYGVSVESAWLEAMLSVPAIALLFGLLFKYVPDVYIRWRDVWLGGGVSAVLFTIGKAGIGYYIGHTGTGSAYGAAGSLVALLVWVYYSALIFFFGAEFTQAWATRHQAVQPKPYAQAGAAPQSKGAAEAEEADKTNSARMPS